MGYTTDFSGSFSLSRPATETEKNYINLFSGSRRMKRDVNKLIEMYNGKNGYPFTEGLSLEEIYGVEGEYFVLDDGEFGQSRDNSIIDYNEPPGQLSYSSNIDFQTRWNENNKRIKNGSCQPGLWCQWVLNDDGTELEWDGSEKFYHYIEWLQYLINHFFDRWNIQLNGEVKWEGEDPDDIGKIIVTNNIIKVESQN